MNLKEKMNKFKDKISNQNLNKDIVENDTKNKQIGLEIKLPGCDEFVPLGKAQYNRKYLDDIGPRLLIICDECAELLEPSGGRSTEMKEEDALKQEMVGLIKSITQLGRSSGIHMVLAPLKLTTLIPTTKGIKSMLTIEPGDYVFDSNGNPTKVLSKSEVKMSDKMYDIHVTLQIDKLTYCETMIIGSTSDHRFHVKVMDIETGDSEEKIASAAQIYDLINEFKQNGNSGKHVWIKNNLYEDYENAQFIPFGSEYENYPHDWMHGLVQYIVEVPNDAARCIEVESEEHLFSITSKDILESAFGDECIEKINSGEIEMEEVLKYCILTHNTQRNDASIIPGVIQNNPLALNTKLVAKRKI